MSVRQSTVKSRFFYICSHIWNFLNIAVYFMGQPHKQNFEWLKIRFLKMINIAGSSSFSKVFFIKICQNTPPSSAGRMNSLPSPLGYESYRLGREG